VKSPTFPLAGSKKFPPTIVGVHDGASIVVAVTVAVTVTVDALVTVTAVQSPSKVTVEIGHINVVTKPVTRGMLPHCVVVDVGDDVEEPVAVIDVDADAVVEGNRHEQAELSLEVDALQGEAKAGKPVVAV